MLENYDLTMWRRSDISNGAWIQENQYVNNLQTDDLLANINLHMVSGSDWDWNDVDDNISNFQIERNNIIYTATGSQNGQQSHISDEEEVYAYFLDASGGGIEGDLG